MFKRFDKSLRRAFNFAFCVRILYSQIEHTAALVRQSFADKNGEKSAEMDKTGRARSETGHFCALGQFSLRISFRDVLFRKR